MKKIVLRIVSAICMVLLCFSMASCSSYKVDKGYSYFGSLPSMFLGIRTNQTEYPLEDVSLEIAYGWAEGYLDEGLSSFILCRIYVYDEAGYGQE